jgi:hypothetical protein
VLWDVCTFEADFPRAVLSRALLLKSNLRLCAEFSLIRGEVGTLPSIFASLMVDLSLTNYGRRRDRAPRLPTEATLCCPAKLWMFGSVVANFTALNARTLVGWSLDLLLLFGLVSTGLSAVIFIGNTLSYCRKFTMRNLRVCSAA